VIAARGRLPGRIGVVGALPFGQYRLLAGQIPDMVDLGAAYTGLRLVKSSEEVAALRLGAALTDAAVAALARPPRLSSGRRGSPRSMTWCTASAAVTSRRSCRLPGGRSPNPNSRWPPG
jgi:Xaa-Pro aminopeptidase